MQPFALQRHLVGQTSAMQAITIVGGGRVGSALMDMGGSEKVAFHRWILYRVLKRHECHLCPMTQGQH